MTSSDRGTRCRVRSVTGVAADLGTSPTGSKVLSESRLDTTEVNSRRTRRTNRARRLGPSDLIVVPAMLVVGCLVTFARDPSVILHPQLWAEDGTVFLQAAYNQGWHAP